MLMSMRATPPPPPLPGMLNARLGIPPGGLGGMALARPAARDSSRSRAAVCWSCFAETAKPATMPLEPGPHAAPQDVGEVSARPVPPLTPEKLSKLSTPGGIARSASFSRDDSPEPLLAPVSAAGEEPAPVPEDEPEFCWTEGSEERSGLDPGSGLGVGPSVGGGGPGSLGESPGGDVSGGGGGSVEGGGAGSVGGFGPPTGGGSADGGGSLAGGLATGASVAAAAGAAMLRNVSTRPAMRPARARLMLET
jgi:hypothetical protein